MIDNSVIFSTNGGMVSFEITGRDASWRDKLGLRLVEKEAVSLTTYVNEIYAFDRD